jgi:hypothetical protein
MELLSIEDSLFYNCTETVALTNLNLRIISISHSNLTDSKIIIISSKLESFISDNSFSRVKIMKTSISNS